MFSVESEISYKENVVFLPTMKIKSIAIVAIKDL